MSVVPVVLCGGAGTRLWPVSREMHPKPFIRLNDGQSLLQKAFIRGAQLPDVSEVIVVTNTEFFFKAADELREVNETNAFATYILEPVGRNTAAAIAAATLVCAQKDPEAIILILPADHLIQDTVAFARAVAEANVLAIQDKIVTFGIYPESPETAYGYIEVEGNDVIHFVEKPDIATAQKYVDSGRFLWNSGMFCFKAKIMQDALKQYCPNILKAVLESLAHANIITDEESQRYELPIEKFELVPEDSIDYAVMEKSSRMAVIPCNIGWSDIGSWSAFGNLLPKDEKGNRVQGEVILHDVENCQILSSSRMVGAVGVNDLVIIDTADAVLVAHKDRLQDVKHVYNELKNSGHETHKFHRTVNRPWGSYTVLEEGEGFKIKRVVVKPDASLSLQMHRHRSEHWVVVSGEAKVMIDNDEKLVAVNESIYVHAGQSHRLTNPGAKDLVIIEVQTGTYLEEDDIVRFEDNYGRIKLAV